MEPQEVTQMDCEFCGHAKAVQFGHTDFGQRHPCDPCWDKYGHPRDDSSADDAEHDRSEEEYWHEDVE